MADRNPPRTPLALSPEALFRYQIVSAVKARELSGATTQLVVNRRDRVDVIADDFPLGRCGHRGLEVALKPVETIGRSPATTRYLSCSPTGWRYPR